jgi:alkaline phosphatase D
LTLAAVYWSAFIKSFVTTSPFEIISDEIDIITRETVSQGYDSEADTDEITPLVSPQNEPLEELDVTETVTLAPKSLHLVRSLLLGLPSPISLFWTLVTSSINLALVLMVLDMVYSAPLLHEEHDLVFARVGFVSYDSARLIVREPRVSKLPLYLSYRYAGPPIVPGTKIAADTAWKHAETIDDITIDTDHTASADILKLLPETRYQYAWSNNQSGVFTTAPKPGHFPTTNNNTFTFLFSSCIKPRVPYSPFDHPLHIKGLEYIADSIPSLSPQFMLFLGDFIYIDVPYRLGVSAETYRAEYRRVYASPSWPAATRNLPWLHVIDDHEIANDWDGNTTGLYKAAADPWHNYQVTVNPPSLQPDATYFSFIQGPLAVFMLDTRRYRTPESKNATDPRKSMLGPDQLAHLLTWIKTPPPAGVRWKTIVSSVPFTKNWRFGDTDTWGTYLHERSKILEAMWSASLAQGVGMLVISGDRHEFAATRIVDETGKLKGEVMEFSVSPLNMFYLPLTNTYKQKDQEDQQVKYIPAGNSKFGAMQFSSSDAGEPVLNFRLFIDGKEAYTQRVVAPSKA